MRIQTVPRYHSRFTGRTSAVDLVSRVFLIEYDSCNVTGGFDSSAGAAAHGLSLRDRGETTRVTVNDLPLSIRVRDLS